MNKIMSKHSVKVYILSCFFFLATCGSNNESEKKLHLIKKRMWFKIN